MSPPSDPAAVDVSAPRPLPPAKPKYDTPPAEMDNIKEQEDFILPPDPATVMDTSGDIQDARQRRSAPATAAATRTDAERRAAIEKQEAALLAQRQATLEAVNLKSKSTNAETLFSLTKTPCYGKCEEYKLEVLDNGVLRLRGKKNTKLVGEFYTKPIGFKYDELLDAYKKFMKSNPADVYPTDSEAPADISSTVLGYSDKKGREQEVIVYYGEPEAFTKLMELAQNMLDTQRWEK